MISTRRTLAVLFLTVPLAWAGALTSAQVVAAAAAEVEATTVTGWVVDANGWLDKGLNVRLVARATDSSSWLGKGGSGAADIAGAQARDEDGDRLVLVSDSGYVYSQVVPTLSTAPADIPSLAKYCEQRVRVTGKVIMRGDRRGIVIDSVAAYLPDAEPERHRADSAEPTNR